MKRSGFLWYSICMNAPLKRGTDSEGNTMKSNEIEIMRTFLCALDGGRPAPLCSEIKINDEDAIYGIIQKLVAAALEDTKSKEGNFAEGDYLDEAVTDDPDDLGAFAETVSNTVFELVSGSTEVRSGSGIFVFCIVEEQPLVGFFKMNYRETYICKADEDDKVNWAIVSNALPKASIRECEYFLINILDRTVRMSDSEFFIGGETKVNYLADRILKLRAKRSEKEKVDIIRDTTIETIRECYKPEEVAEKVMSYRKEVAEHVGQTGRVSVAKIEQAVFSDDDEAKAAYRSKLEHREIAREPMEVSRKTERAFQRKQKIVTDNGIELLVPVEFLKNADIVEYQKDEEGNITILLKDIHTIKA